MSAVSNYRLTGKSLLKSESPAIGPKKEGNVRVLKKGGEEKKVPDKLLPYNYWLNSRVSTSLA